jgi:uncharacterized damage-inducible protein DinB
MGPQIRWYDRKFDFSFTVELWPNVRARLRGTPVRMQEALLDSSRETVIAKATGKWSAQEHAGHLLNLEPLWLARVEDYAAGNEQLSTTDLSNRQTDAANYNAQSLEQILGDFRAARGKLLRRVDELDPGLFAQAIRHPRLQVPMRLIDHLYFAAEHDDHHLAWIWDLVSAPLAGSRRV